MKLDFRILEEGENKQGSFNIDEARPGEKVVKYDMQVAFEEDAYLLTATIQIRFSQKQKVAQFAFIPIAPQASNSFEEQETLAPAVQSQDNEVEPLVPTEDLVLEENGAATENTAPKKQSRSLGDTNVSISVYATLKNVTERTVRNWIAKGWLVSAQKVDNTWYIDPTDNPIGDTRRRAKSDGSSINEDYKAFIETSYQSTQDWLKANTYFTDEVRPFIRNLGEAKYYKNKQYHEIEVNGKHALVIDFKPDFYSEEHKMTNRELIEKGNSPVFHSDPSQVLHLHHIGQRKDSPLAIIPSGDHLASHYSGSFHPYKSAQLEDLHTPAFEEEKRRFWKTFLKQYDTYHTYRRIPCFSSKLAHDKRNNIEVVYESKKRRRK